MQSNREDIFSEKVTIIETLGILLSISERRLFNLSNDHLIKIRSDLVKRSILKSKDEFSDKIERFLSKIATHFISTDATPQNVKLLFHEVIESAVQWVDDFYLHPPSDKKTMIEVLGMLFDLLEKQFFNFNDIELAMIKPDDLDLINERVLGSGFSGKASVYLCNKDKPLDPRIAALMANQNQKNPSLLKRIKIKSISMRFIIFYI